jgi:glycosyltransferase involved in cell wall biosynthesis
LRLQQAGHSIFASTEKTPPISPKLTALAEQGVALRLREPPRGALLQALLVRLTGMPTKDAEKDWMRAQKPDLVVVSMGGVSNGWLWLKFCHEAGLPYVCVVHSNSNRAWIPDTEAAEMAIAYAGARAVYCVSRHNLKLLEFQLGIELPHARVIWSPYNPTAKELLPWPAEDGVTRLACVARLEPEAKGQDILFQVLTRPEWRSRRVELNLYGAGPNEKILRAMAERLQLANIHFHGQVSNIAQVWEKNHLLVLPSRHEGLPLTLIEAMACGRPAVVTDVGGNAEMCVDGATGFVAAAAAEGPFAEALERAWARKAQWEAMGRAGRARVDKIVSRDAVGDFCELLLKCASVP